MGACTGVLLADDDVAGELMIVTLVLCFEKTVGTTTLQNISYSFFMI
jgi:hypothetical protein